MHSSIDIVGYFRPKDQAVQHLNPLNWDNTGKQYNHILAPLQKGSLD